MKTNKQEREAIASKFYKRMEAQMVDKNEEFKKTSTFKELVKLKAEKNKLNAEARKLEDAIEKKMIAFNKANPSEYWKLTNTYNYRNENRDFRLELESMWSCQADLTNAILIAQVGAETVEDMMKILEQEVSL